MEYQNAGSRGLARDPPDTWLFKAGMALPIAVTLLPVNWIHVNRDDNFAAVCHCASHLKFKQARADSDRNTTTRARVT